MTEHRSDEATLESFDMEGGPTRLPRSGIIVALFGLIIVTCIAVAALAYNVIFNHGSTDSLTTIAAVGIGGLVAALGASAKRN